ncbi:MAG: hypothetical protein WB579_08475 [Bryobacteraceae bacterium]
MIKVLPEVTRVPSAGHVIWIVCAGKAVSAPAANNEQQIWAIRFVAEDRKVISLCLSLRLSTLDATVPSASMTSVEARAGVGHGFLRVCRAWESVKE